MENCFLERKQEAILDEFIQHIHTMIECRIFVYDSREFACLPSTPLLSAAHLVDAALTINTLTCLRGAQIQCRKPLRFLDAPSTPLTRWRQKTRIRAKAACSALVLCGAQLVDRSPRPAADFGRSSAPQRAPSLARS